MVPKRRRPWGTPLVTFCTVDIFPSILTNWLLLVKLHATNFNRFQPMGERCIFLNRSSCGNLSKRVQIKGWRTLIIVQWSHHAYRRHTIQTVFPGSIVAVALQSVFPGRHIAIREFGRQLARRLHRILSFHKLFSNSKVDFSGRERVTSAVCYFLWISDFFCLVSIFWDIYLCSNRFEKSLQAIKKGCENNLSKQCFQSHQVPMPCCLSKCPTTCKQLQVKLWFVFFCSGVPV